MVSTSAGEPANQPSTSNAGKTKKKKPAAENATKQDVRFFSKI